MGGEQIFLCCFILFAALLLRIKGKDSVEMLRVCQHSTKLSSLAFGRTQKA